MKSRHLNFIFLAIVFIPFTTIIHAQSGHWQFKEIVYGNHFKSTNKPEAIELDVNEGYVQFSIPQKNDCVDRYRFSYKFHQEMNSLQLPLSGDVNPSYSYEFEFIPLSSPCYDPEVSSYSNPSVRVTHWNSTSGHLGVLKKKKEWKYENHKQYIDEGSVDYYAYKTSVYKNAGKGVGEFNIIGPNTEDVDYFMESYPGLITDFRILFKGQSSLGKEEAFYFDVLFVYELTKGALSIGIDPCKIEPPDCSCCPGTIPTWNFQSNEGECLCPEGKVWDRRKKSCVNPN